VTYSVTLTKLELHELSTSTSGRVMGHGIELLHLWITMGSLICLWLCVNY